MVFRILYTPPYSTNSTQLIPILVFAFILLVDNRFPPQDQLFLYGMDALGYYTHSTRLILLQWNPRCPFPFQYYRSHLGCPLLSLTPFAFPVLCY